MGISQVMKLLKNANNHLPSVVHKYVILQKQHTDLKSNLITAAREFQNLSNQISYMNKRLDNIKSECKRETALLQALRQQISQLEEFVYNYKNNNEEYVKIIKSIESKVHDCLSDKKAFLKLAIFSLIQSMRSNPDKYTCLVYHDNDDNKSSLSSSTTNRGNSNVLNIKSSSTEVVLPPPPYDDYIIEDYKSIVLEEAEKLYNVLVDQLVFEVINENVTKQSAETMSSSLPVLPLKEGGADDDMQN